MKSVFISGSTRSNVGKKDTKALRLAGNVPCVLYGGESQVHFFAPETAFKSLLFTPDVHTVNLDIEGNKVTALLQDVQFNPMNDKLMHADFLQISEGKPVVISIPVKAIGNSPGIREGGKLSIKLRKLKVRALVQNLPDSVEVDISKLEIGQGIKVGHLNIEGVTFLDSANIEVLGVGATRASRQAAQDEAKKK